MGITLHEIHKHSDRGSRLLQGSYTDYRYTLSVFLNQKHRFTH